MSDEAWIEFADEMAATFARLAGRLRDEAMRDDAILNDQEAVPPAQGKTLGKRQTQILEVLGTCGSDGLKTADIASQIQYQVPNTYSTLQGLQSGGFVELTPNSHPMRWRLSARYRGGNADPFLAAAGVLRSGEWTTYGDISIAVRGDNRAARAVGRAAATLDEFPNAHRVLREGGTVPEGWHDDSGHGEEECRRLLDAEGVRFDARGRANAAQRISWDVIRERLGQATVE